MEEAGQWPHFFALSEGIRQTYPAAKELRVRNAYRRRVVWMVDVNSRK
jgi:hypothetical protein